MIIIDMIASEPIRIISKWSWLYLEFICSRFEVDKEIDKIVTGTDNGASIISYEIDGENKL